MFLLKTILSGIKSNKLYAACAQHIKQVIIVANPFRVNKFWNAQAHTRGTDSHFLYHFRFRGSADAYVCSWHRCNPPLFWLIQNNFQNTRRLPNLPLQSHAQLFLFTLRLLWLTDLWEWRWIALSPTRNFSVSPDCQIRLSRWHTGPLDDWHVAEM